MASVALARLGEERRNWRRDHPPGFFARPEKTASGGDESVSMAVLDTGRARDALGGRVRAADDGVPEGVPGQADEV